MKSPAKPGRPKRLRLRAVTSNPPRKPTKAVGKTRAKTRWAVEKPTAIESEVEAETEAIKIEEIETWISGEVGKGVAEAVAASAPV